MRPTHRSVLILAAVLGLVAGGLGWQRHIAAQLRGQVERQRAEAADLARLQAENRRLVAAQPTEDELAELLVGQVTLEQLHTQRAALQHREETMVQAGATEPAVPSLQGNSVSYQLWSNAGQATPAAAFQTVLWAATAGDLDALAGLLVFDDEAKARATETFGRLPAATQNEIGTPEKLIALLAATDVPLGRASILTQVATPTGSKITSQLIDAEGKARTATFTLQAEDGRWRLQVPANVVTRYDNRLQAAAAGSTTLK